MRLSRAVAFTLVELLIVVVIIGILSTLGIPQYQKLVRKAQATEAKTVLRSLADAVWQYHIETGTWPAAFSDLKIPLPNSNYFNYIYYKDPGSGKFPANQFSVIAAYKDPQSLGNGEPNQYDIKYHLPYPQPYPSDQRMDASFARSYIYGKKGEFNTYDWDGTLVKSGSGGQL